MVGLSCASVHLRIGRIAKSLARNHIEDRLAAVKTHMKYKGENLKRLPKNNQRTVTNRFAWHKKRHVFLSGYHPRAKGTQDE